jgi:ubiquinone/menaquinone biosynthesis C-methylase UbiE
MTSAERTLTTSEVVRVYTRTAPFYDLWARLTETRAWRRALELAWVRDGESVLEVAVGTGLAFAEILRQNPTGRNEGVDLTEAMLARARGKAERSTATNWHLHLGNAERLDFADATFDLLLNCYMFDLLPEESFGRVLSEFHRVLKPGCRLVLVNLAPGSGLLPSLWSQLHRLNPAWVGGCRPVRLTGPVEQAGFTIQTCEHTKSAGVPSEVILAHRR